MRIRRLTEMEWGKAAELTERVLGKTVNIAQLVREQQAIVVGGEDERGLHGCGVISSGGHICILVVEPALQQGMGEQILDALCTACFQQFSVTRITALANLAEVECYRACGFVPQSSEMLGEDETCIPMEKILAAAEIPPEKKNTGLVIALTAGGILFLFIVAGLLFFTGKKISDYITYQRVMEQRELQEKWEKEQEDTKEALPEEPEIEEPLSYETILEEELSDVEVYLEEVPFELAEEVYRLEEDSDGEHLKFNIHYPQIKNLPEAIAETVNAELKRAAMLNVESLYTNPTEELKQLFEEQEYLYRESEVGYKVTYLSENLVSVVYADHYFMGSAYAEYASVRTRIINLKTGEVILPEETYETDEDLAKDFHQKLLEKDEESEAYRELDDEVFQRALAGEIVDGRYMSGMALTKNGVLLTFTYHYRSEDGNIISRGWDTIEYEKKDFMSYEKGHEMWKLVESDN